MMGQRVDYLTRTGLALGLLISSLGTSAIAADVSDAAHFFSPAAVEQANQKIRELEQKSGHEIRIETHATVPADKIDEVAKMDRAEKQKFVHDWVKNRAREVKENGALILICKDPARIESWFSRKLHDEGFTQKNNQEISEALITGFKAKDYDRALKNTVAELDQAYSNLSASHSLRATQPGSGQNASGVPHRGPVEGPMVIQRHRQSSWMPVVWLLGLVFGGMFLISLLSRLFGGGRGSQGMAGGYGGRPGYGGYGGNPGYGGYGGGGFLSSLAGGIFGAAAGNWLYDSFSGRSAHAHEPYSTTHDPLSGSRTLGDDSPAANDAWSDEGSSSGGGWFDSGDGGGGFGSGGDFGGGDDFSSGGDF